LRGCGDGKNALLLYGVYFQQVLGCTEEKAMNSGSEAGRYGVKGTGGEASDRYIDGGFKV